VKTAVNLFAVASASSAALPGKSGVSLAVAISRTGAPTVSGHVAGKVHGGGLSGKLDNDIGIAVGGAVAWPVARVSRAVCSMAEGTSKAGMRIGMASANIREGGAVRPAGCQGAGAGHAVTRTATVAGACLSVASPTIGRGTGGNGIHPDGAAVGMASSTAGKGGRPGGR